MLLQAYCAAACPAVHVAQLAAALHQLQEILSAHEGALQNAMPGDAEDNADGASASAEFAPVLAAVLDPLMEMCRRSAEVLSPDSPARLDAGSQLDPSSYHVYLINCLAAMQVRCGASWLGSGLRGWLFTGWPCLVDAKHSASLQLQRYRCGTAHPGLQWRGRGMV